jgi:hypothetical protein
MTPVKEDDLVAIAEIGGHRTGTAAGQIKSHGGEAIANFEFIRHLIFLFAFACVSGSFRPVWPPAMNQTAAHCSTNS